MSIIRLYQLSLLSLFLLSLTACSVPIYIHFTAAKQLNPNKQQQSFPVLIRVYELRNIFKFQQASFTDLWQADQQTLGNSLLYKQQLFLAPGAQCHLKIDKLAHAKYLAIMALFQYPSQQWRIVYKLSPLLHYLPSFITVYVHGDRITKDNSY